MVLSLLQLMNFLDQPESTLGFSLGAVHPMGLGKCIATCMHHYGIIQSIFIALKLLYALPIYHPTPFLMTFYKVNNALFSQEISVRPIF